MLRKIIKNKKGQYSTEYVMVFSMVIASVIAMQTLIQNVLQTRMKEAVTYLTEQTGALGKTIQYGSYDRESQQK